MKSLSIVLSENNKPIHGQYDISKRHLKNGIEYAVVQYDADEDWYDEIVIVNDLESGIETIRELL